MKTTLTTMQQRLYHAAFSLCCAVLFLAASSCRADQVPMSAEATLATTATITLGEPVMLHYKLSNLSDNQHLAVLSGVYNTQWYTLNLKDAKGNQVPLIPDTRPLDPSGFHAGDVATFATAGNRDGWQDGYIVASKSFVVPRPGRYVLTLHVRASYTLVAPTLENPVLIKSMMNSAGTVLIQDFNFPLIVTSINPTVLQAKANALKETINKEQSSMLLLPEMDELFSMPEAQASPVWEKMALQAGPMNRDLIADKLANLHSTKATDILFQMMATSTSNDEFISRRLSEVYNESEPALKGHIKALALQRGVEMPETVSVPQVLD